MANLEHLRILKVEGVEAWNKWREENPDIKPDLQKADLMKSDLMYANLQGAVLENSNIQEALLSGANLQKANLLKANLQKANISGANLQRAKPIKANLQEANLAYANLQEAMLMDANLQEANLHKANLQEANVSRVQYKKLGKCSGIKLEGCYGSPRFIRDAKDNEYVEEFENHHPILYKAWWLSSDCGRSIWRWVLWSLFFTLFFALNFALMGTDEFVVVNNLPTASFWDSFLTMIYFSVVTVTTLGFGDIAPRTHWAAFLVTLEVIIGYVMLGGLISIMATKLARRAA